MIASIAQVHPPATMTPAAIPMLLAPTALILPVQPTATTIGITSRESTAATIITTLRLLASSILQRRSTHLAHQTPSKPDVAPSSTASHGGSMLPPAAVLTIPPTI